MDNYIQGKVIVITGSASGFGMLTAQMAAEMGGRIICADINEENLKKVVAGICEKGGSAAYIVCDVTDKEQVDLMARFAVDTYGRIDVLINNAGIMPLAYFADHEKAWKSWDKCIDINLKGTIYGISAVYDQMIKQGEGQIINISSIFGNAPVVGSGVYQATKAGVRYLSESLRQESQGKIKVTTISPTGTAGTNLSSAIVNFDALKGVYGRNFEVAMGQDAALSSGEGENKNLTDPNSISYMRMDAVNLTKNIIYCINQPMGVSISEITVRASGEAFII